MDLLMLAFVTVFFERIHGNLDALIIGDWGGQSAPPYTTEEEIASADAMNEIASLISPSMIWALGDNFYLEGVTDVNDPRFKETWEDVFNGDAIQSLPFYVIAGNHDHLGSVAAQIEYSKQSQRWRYPDYWYSVHWHVPNTEYTLQLIMIDTQLACGGTMDEEYCTYYDIREEECILSPLGADDGVLASKQWQWLENELKSSTASFLIVAGHYPVWSVAEHGSTQCLVDDLRPLLIEYDVTMYFSGHDHTFSYFVEKEHPNIGYVVSGGTHLCNPSIAHMSSVPSGSLKFHDCKNGGFTRLHIDNDGLYVEYYFGSDSNAYFTTPTYKPRLTLSQTAQHFLSSLLL